MPLANRSKKRAININPALWLMANNGLDRALITVPKTIRGFLVFMMSLRYPEKNFAIKDEEMAMPSMIPILEWAILSSSAKNAPKTLNIIKLETDHKKLIHA